jgi:hypothetical protein
LNLIWIMPAQGVSTLTRALSDSQKGAIIMHDPIPLDPTTFGVGARVTLAVMRDDYVEVLLRALAEADAGGLSVYTGDVSTYVAGAEADIARYLTQLVAAVGRSGAHVSAVIHLSRGCPGEVACELPGEAGPLRSEIPELPDAGVRAAAEWALYPLDDGGTPGTQPDHMRDIYAAIDYAKNNDTFVRSEHFVTRLEGDVARVLATVFAGWILVGRTVQHVTSHVTLSINSPSA